MKKVLFIMSLLFLSPIVFSHNIEYKGNHILAVKHYNGTVDYLSNGDNISILNNSHVYLNLGYKSYDSKDTITDSMDFMWILIVGSFLGLVLLSSTWIVIRYVI